MKTPTIFKLIALCLCLGFISLSSCSGDLDNNFDNLEEIDGEEDDEEVEDDDNTDDSNDNSDDSTDGGEGEITLYGVSSDGTLSKIKDYDVQGTSLELQQDTAKHDAIWEMVKKVIPASHMGKISEFLIYAGAASGTLGFVVEKETDLSKWQYAIAVDLAYETGTLNGDGELLHTIIHEFGHVVTLNNDQVNASIPETDCMNFFVGEGCANSDAYINQLQTQFWADIWTEFTAIDSEEGQQTFYTTYQDRFVTDYAATNPGEDIAEIFAAFVLRAGGVNGTSIVEQKFELMYSAEELTQLRTTIRDTDLFGLDSKKFSAKTTRKYKNFCGTSRK